MMLLILFGEELSRHYSSSSTNQMSVVRTFFENIFSTLRCPRDLYQEKLEGFKQIKFCIFGYRLIVLCQETVKCRTEVG